MTNKSNKASSDYSLFKNDNEYINGIEYFFRSLIGIFGLILFMLVINSFRNDNNPGVIFWVIFGIPGMVSLKFFFATLGKRLKSLSISYGNQVLINLVMFFTFWTFIPLLPLTIMNGKKKNKKSLKVKFTNFLSSKKTTSNANKSDKSLIDASEELKKLKELFDLGILSKKEYDEKAKELKKIIL